MCGRQIIANREGCGSEELGHRQPLRVVRLCRLASLVPGVNMVRRRFAEAGRDEVTGERGYRYPLLARAFWLAWRSPHGVQRWLIDNSTKCVILATPQRQRSFFLMRSLLSRCSFVSCTVGTPGFLRGRAVRR